MKPFLEGKKPITDAALRPPAPGLESAPRLAPATPAAPPENRSAQVEVIKQGDKVVRLVVTCACGEKIEVNCLYPPGV